MLKHIVHLFFFVAGAGVGVWWGVNHPTQAANLAAQEQAKIQQAIGIATGKKQVLQQIVNDQQTAAAAPDAPAPAASRLDKYKQMLNQADQEFDNAKASQSTP